MIKSQPAVFTVLFLLLHLGFGFSLCTILVQFEQAGKDFVVGQQACAPVVAPAVGLGHRFIERLVGVVQPCGAGVVEVGQGALFQDCLAASGDMGRMRSG